MDNCLDSLCSRCLGDVPAFLTSGEALCAACMAIELRVPSLDRAQLLAVLEERAQAEEQAQAPV